MSLLKNIIIMTSFICTLVHLGPKEADNPDLVREESTKEIFNQ